MLFEAADLLFKKMYVYGYFAYVYVCGIHMVGSMCAPKPEEGVVSPGTRITVLNQNVGTGN